MVYIMKDFMDIGPDQYEKILENLPKKRVEKVRKYKFYKDRLMSALSFALLIHGINWEYKEVVSQMDYDLNKYGKPYLLNCESISFNISHCRSAIAVAISKEEVGIDVEELGATAKEVVSTIGITLPERYGQVERYWTIIEAYGKYKGLGLNYAYEKMNFDFLEEDRWQPYEAALVYSKNFPEFSMTVFAKEKLEVKEVNIADVLVNLID